MGAWRYCGVEQRSLGRLPVWSHTARRVVASGLRPLSCASAQGMPDPAGVSGQLCTCRMRCPSSRGKEGLCCQAKTLLCPQLRRAANSRPVSGPRSSRSRFPSAMRPRRVCAHVLSLGGGVVSCRLPCRHRRLRPDVREEFSRDNDGALPRRNVRELVKLAGVGDSVTLDEVLAGAIDLVQRWATVVAAPAAHHPDTPAHDCAPSVVVFLQR